MRRVRGERPSGPAELPSSGIGRCGARLPNLAFDGLSPLYWKPNGGEDAATRLACTIQAAFKALEVSAEFL